MSSDDCDGLAMGWRMWAGTVERGSTVHIGVLLSFFNSAKHACPSHVMLLERLKLCTVVCSQLRRAQLVSAAERPMLPPLSASDAGSVAVPFEEDEVGLRHDEHGVFGVGLVRHVGEDDVLDCSYTCGPTFL